MRCIMLETDLLLYYLRGIIGLRHCRVCDWLRVATLPYGRR
jgi:hypothetical protein